MKTPAISKSGKPAALTSLPVESDQSGEEQGAPPVPVSLGPEHIQELYLPGRAPALGRVGDFLVESGLIAGTAAVIALLIFVFVWQIFLLISFALAVGVYFGVVMLLPARTPDRLVVDGLTASELDHVLAEGRVGVARIERDAERVPTPVARLRVHAIAVTANRILADFKERPRHVPEARFAFDALLNATVMALDRYQKFWRVSGPVAQRGREVLEDRVLPTIDRGFQQLLDKLLKDDLRALNVDVVVLEQMLDLEGLSEEGITRQQGSAADADVESVNRASK